MADDSLPIRLKWTMGVCKPCRLQGLIEGVADHSIKGAEFEELDALLTANENVRETIWSICPLHVRYRFCVASSSSVLHRQFCNRRGRYSARPPRLADDGSHPGTAGTFAAVAAGFYSPAGIE